jgi:hypothetical protein
MIVMSTSRFAVTKMLYRHVPRHAQLLHRAS